MKILKYTSLSHHLTNHVEYLHKNVINPLKKRFKAEQKKNTEVVV